MSQQFFSLLEAKVAPPVFIFVFNIFPFFGFFVPVYLILQIGRLGNPDKPIFGSKRKKMKAKTFFFGDAEILGRRMSADIFICCIKHCLPLPVAQHRGSILASPPAALGLIPSICKKFQRKKLSMLVRLINGAV